MTDPSWKEVARSDSTAAVESVTYSGARGYYRWTVRSAGGGGAFALGLRRR